MERFISPEFENALIRILKEETFDIVQFEMLFMSPYLATVRKYSSARTVLRAHNIEHMIWKRIADTSRNPFKRIYLRHLVKRLKDYELTVIRQFDGIAAITDNDAAFFTGAISVNSRLARGILPGVIAIPFGINTANFTDTTEEAGFPTLFSIGAMDWIPNLEGIRWFLDQVWPEIHRKFPSLRFYLAGRNMPSSLTGRRDPNVENVGEVENASDFIRSRSILIVPLFSGSGIRIKIIEGMAAGKTVISTAIGAEGIHYTHGKDIFIANTTEEFVQSISSCVDDKELCQSVGRNARDLILREYSCDLIISRLIGFYQQIGA